MENNIQGFSFFSSYYSAIKALKNEATQKELALAIVKYAFEGELDCSSDVVRMAMELIKPSIDISIKRSVSGKKGMDSRWNKNQSDNKPITNLYQTDNKPITNYNFVIDEEKEQNKEKELFPQTPFIEKENKKEKEENSGELCAHACEKKISECKQIMLDDFAWIETLCMNKRADGHKSTTIDSVRTWIEKFFRKLENDGEYYKTVSDTKRHFSNWWNIELKKEKDEKRNEPAARKYTVFKATSE